MNIYKILMIFSLCAVTVSFAEPSYPPLSGISVDAQDVKDVKDAKLISFLDENRFYPGELVILDLGNNIYKLATVIKESDPKKSQYVVSTNDDTSVAAESYQAKMLGKVYAPNIGYRVLSGIEISENDITRLKEKKLLIFNPRNQFDTDELVILKTDGTYMLGMILIPSTRFKHRYMVSISYDPQARGESYEVKNIGKIVTKK